MSCAIITASFIPYLCLRQGGIFEKDTDSRLPKASCVRENILSRANTQILTASSSQEILSIHKSEKADLIVIDLDMPDMSGDGICSLLRKEPDPNPVKVLIAVEAQGN